MGQRAGWEQPNWFEPVGRECDLVLSKVGIIDLTPYGKFEVKGRDAADFLDRVFANELPKVSIVIL